MCTMWSSCKKNPGHASFIPIKDFSLEHLPVNRNHEEKSRLFNLIQHLAKLTVRIRGSHVSENRPPGDPFYEFRGRFVPRMGTGWVRNVSDMDLKDCSDECSTWRIEISTAAHVIFDDTEARDATIDFFYDDDTDLVANGKTRYSSRGCHTLKCVGVISSDSALDCAVLKCVTQDYQVFHRLRSVSRQIASESGIVSTHLEKDSFTKPRRCYPYNKACLDSRMCQREQATVVIVSHPHGRSKHVTIGNFDGKLYSQANASLLCPVLWLIEQISSSDKTLDLSRWREKILLYRRERLLNAREKVAQSECFEGCQTKQSGICLSEAFSLNQCKACIFLGTEDQNDDDPSVTRETELLERIRNCRQCKIFCQENITEVGNNTEPTSPISEALRLIASKLSNEYNTVIQKLKEYSPFEMTNQHKETCVKSRSSCEACPFSFSFDQGPKSSGKVDRVIDENESAPAIRRYTRKTARENAEVTETGTFMRHKTSSKYNDMAKGLTAKESNDVKEEKRTKTNATFRTRSTSYPTKSEKSKCAKQNPTKEPCLSDSQQPSGKLRCFIPDTENTLTNSLPSLLPDLVPKFQYRYTTATCPGSSGAPVLIHQSEEYDDDAAMDEIKTKKRRNSSSDNLFYTHSSWKRDERAAEIGAALRLIADTFHESLVLNPTTLVSVKRRRRPRSMGNEALLTQRPCEGSSPASSKPVLRSSTLLSVFHGNRKDSSVDGDSQVLRQDGKHSKQKYVKVSSSPSPVEGDQPEACMESILIEVVFPSEQKKMCEVYFSQRTVKEEKERLLDCSDIDVGPAHHYEMRLTSPAGLHDLIIMKDDDMMLAYVEAIGNDARINIKLKPDAMQEAVQPMGVQLKF